MNLERVLMSLWTRGPLQQVPAAETHSIRMRDTAFALSVVAWSRKLERVATEADSSPRSISAAQIAPVTASLLGSTFDTAPSTALAEVSLPPSVARRSRPSTCANS
eukprot:GHVU01103100.1.p2 GENE.GHVU01103100.1~~GHVU01103100.1.p2  ORF type:complete len:106 (+),score=9.23 GHVU01103100.1:596-913(+)